MNLLGHISRNNSSIQMPQKNILKLHVTMNVRNQRIGMSINDRINSSQDSSVGSISTWYRGGPGFKSQLGREFFNENKVCIRIQG